MRTIKRLLHRLIGPFTRQRDDSRLREEIDAHLALEIEARIHQGLSPADARRQALIKFGGVSGLKERYRDTQGLPALERPLQDLRHAARQLGKTPGFSSLIVITLGLAIGGTTALFSLVDAVLLRPLPFREPHQLVEIWGRDDQRTGMRVPGAILEALRANTRTLQVVGTHDPSGGVLTTTDGAVEIRGETVAPNFLDVFGVAPVKGRGFVQDDGRPNAAATMLVGYGFWRQFLGSDPDAVGRVVHVNAVPYTVIGIMPAGFRTSFFGGADFLSGYAGYWTVYAGNGSRAREEELGYEVVARLSPGATIEQARLEVTAIASSVEVEEWRKSGRRIGLVPLKQEVVGDRASALTLLMVAVALVLGIACANVAQLLLARSDQRLSEFATRHALGASQVQLFRLAIFESLLLSLGGATAGLALAYWLLPLMRTLAPSEIPRLADAVVDGRVMALGVAVSLLVGCLFGLAPALRLSRLPLVQALKRAGGLMSRGRARFRSGLVVTQVASAVVLLAIAALVLQTFFTLLPSSPGFVTAGRAALIWSVRESQFPNVDDRRRRVTDLTERLAAVPGIDAVAVGSGMPFGDDEPRSTPVRSPEDTRPVSAETLRSDLRGVSLNYFELFRIPLLYGRSFSSADRADTPRVALVNRALAHRLGLTAGSMGKPFRVGTAATAPVYQIVGVVEDTRWWGTTLAPLNEVYVPLAQDRASFGFIIIVQSVLDKTSLTRAITQELNAALPGIALPAGRQALTLDEMVGRSFAGPRFNATLVGGFAAVAVALALIGLFGLVAYSVSVRRRELALRMALGARPGNLIATSIRSAALLTLTGTLLGIAIAAYLRKFIEAQLYATNPWDASAFAAASLTMVLTAALAAYWPARRAALADPMSVLRNE